MSRVKTENLPLLALRGRVIFPDTTVSLDVGRLQSLTAVKHATDGDSLLFAVAQKDAESAEIQIDKLYMTGTVVKIKQISRLPGNSLRITVQGLYRGAVRSINLVNDAYFANVDEVTPIHGDEALEEAYLRTAKSVMTELSANDGRLTKEIMANLEKCSEPDAFVNLASHHL